MAFVLNPLEVKSDVTRNHFGPRVRYQALIAAFLGLSEPIVYLPSTTGPRHRSSDVMAVLHQASAVVQNTIRMYLARRRISRRQNQMRNGSARTLQKYVRAQLSCFAYSSLLDREHRRRHQQKAAAARVLQRWFRASDHNRFKPIVLKDDEQEIQTGEGGVVLCLCFLRNPSNQSLPF